MGIPVVPLYPEQFDSDENLYLVKDSIRLTLREDFNPGDKVIKCEGDEDVIARIPPTGKITLTDQCNPLDSRAVSYHYDSFDPDAVEFSGITLLPGFKEVYKQRKVTNVVMNVMADDHNNIKDALIAIQKFVGIKGTEDTEPFGETLEGRINFLRKIVFRPRAWFTVDKTIGLAPLCVEFEEKSFYKTQCPGSITYIWDFGDLTDISVVSTIEVSDIVPGDTHAIVKDVDGGKITKCYYKPGFYTVKLTVENDFGSDTVVFEDLINVRIKAPEEAIIRFVPDITKQIETPGVPPDGPFVQYPRIRSPINTLIHIEIPEGENPATPGYSYAGELLDSQTKLPIDPIVNYEWKLGDDLVHPNSRETKASYSIGGIYDLKLQVDTKYGAYRITTYENSIDIVERVNLWLFLFTSNSDIRSYEFGLISETFKILPANTTTISVNSDFLKNEPNSEQQIREFKRNTSFQPRSNNPSGNQGVTLLCYASGRNEADPPASEEIKIVEYSGFSDTYVNRPSITRQWNWADFHYPGGFGYFVFGAVENYQPNDSPVNLTLHTIALSNLSVSNTTLTASNFDGGADELMQNPAVFDDQGNPIYGHFSVYRTAWKDSTGYLARNDGVGPFFRIKSFYRTEGTIGNPFINVRKMQDIQGTTKYEGDMTNLSTGIYFFDNSGSVSKFNDTDESWSTGGPGFYSSAFRSLQDTSASGYDDLKNTLLLASDGDRRAYISFDYSPNAFIKFNEIDLTFSSLVSRPEGEQWIMGIY